MQTGSRTFDARRFAQVVSSEICTYRFDNQGRRVPKSARMSSVQLGLLNVVVYEGQGIQWGDRCPAQIRDDPSDYFVLSMPLSAQLSIHQDGIDCDLLPGSFAFVTTARPSQAIIQSLIPGGVFRSLHVRIPGPMLRRRLPNIDDVCNREIKFERGAGVLVRAALEDGARMALAEGGNLGPDAQYLGNAWLEMICGVAAPTAEAVAHQPSARDRAPVRIRRLAEAYIEAHLRDPALAPVSIAEYCGVSVRYLHAAFASTTSTTVAAFIRERRLQNCREALMNPFLHQRSIIEIACDWGFEDSSHFSRLFKERFGQSPRQHRAWRHRAIMPSWEALESAAAH